jgi:rhomboid protease GluP
MNYVNRFKAYPLTLTLMTISIVLFLLGQFSPALNEYLYMNGVLHGYSVIVKGEWYRLFTSIFLHADMMHIVMNMLSLYMVGTVVERIFSKSAYLGIYFVSALVGSFSSIYMHLGGLAVGASGAIFGLFGALAGFAFVHRVTMGEQFMSFIKDFGVILLINLVIGFVVPFIDVSAHVGGLIAGMVGGFMVAKNPKYLWAYLGVTLVLLWLSHGYLFGLYAHN